MAERLDTSRVYIELDRAKRAGFIRDYTVHEDDDQPRRWVVQTWADGEFAFDARQAMAFAYGINVAIHAPLDSAGLPR